MMRFLRFAGMFMAVLVFSAATGSACHAAAKVQVDQAIYDAGPVPEGKDVSHEFVLKNVGDQKLTFKPKPC
jgi:hypothetical protein